MSSLSAYENGLRLSREAKQRRRGTCADCGAETRYNGRTTNGPSLLCFECAVKKNGLARRGTGPLGQRILEFCSEPRHFMEISRSLGISKELTGSMLNRMHHHYGLLERLERGVYVTKHD